MIRRRTEPDPTFRYSFWKKEGKHWWAEREDLEQALAEAKVSQDHIKRQMGFGFHHLQDVLEGARVDRYVVAQIEWGLTCDDEPRPASHSI